MHALKMVDQWDHVTGTANTEGIDYNCKKQKAFTQFCNVSVRSMCPW